MQILVAPLEDSILTEITYLSDDATAGTSLSVENAQGFVADDYIAIGRRGYETAELRKIASVVNNTITLSSATSFSHVDGTQIQKILFNQRKFYRATSETGTYQLIATKDIEVDRPDGTFYEDTAGTSSSWYKATYYNEYTLTETSLDDAVACMAAESDHYTSLDEIRNQAGFKEAFGISNENISGYREEAENEFESAISVVYTVPLSTKPKLVRQIVNLLAAGNLLIKEYGMEADIEISKSGQRMLNRAYELIGKIVDGKLKLLDEDGNEIGVKNSNNLASTSNEYGENDDRGSLFNISDEKFTFKDPDNPTS
jgi:hypothetical protein